MNAVDTFSATLGKAGKPGAFKWLLKREFWENRGGFFWAPVIAGAITSGLYLLAGLISRTQFSSVDHLADIARIKGSEEFARVAGQGVDVAFFFGVGIVLLVFAFVVFFYALSSLYDERKDRSVLFWKSMPVSDTQTVLSKAVWALLLGPLASLLIGVALGLALWFLSSLLIMVFGLGMTGFTALFTHSHVLSNLGHALAALPVYATWALPTVGWLMFCSAWVRSKPFLWAVLLPVLACTVISMVNALAGMDLPLDKLWYVVAFRGLLSAVPGTWAVASDGNSLISSMNNGAGIPTEYHIENGWQVFTTPDLWIGAVIGVAFIAAAIYLRRWRELAD